MLCPALRRARYTSILVSIAASSARRMPASGRKVPSSKPPTMPDWYLSLIHICLDVPSDGTYLLDGKDVGQMNKNQLAEIRNELLGFIFQQYNLLPKLNLVENVEVPLMYAGVPKGERRERAKEALRCV